MSCTCIARRRPTACSSTSGGVPRLPNGMPPMSGIGMSLGIIVAGIIIILLGILARLQYIKVYDDEIVLYKVFSTYRLPIDEVSSVGRGWLGFIKIGTSSYWLGKWFIFMTGGKQVVSEAMRIIKQRNAK